MSCVTGCGGTGTRPLSLRTSPTAGMRRTPSSSMQKCTTEPWTRPSLLRTSAGNQVALWCSSTYWVSMQLMSDHVRNRTGRNTGSVRGHRQRPVISAGTERLEHRSWPCGTKTPASTDTRHLNTRWSTLISRPGELRTGHRLPAESGRATIQAPTPSLADRHRHPCRRDLRAWASGRPEMSKWRLKFLARLGGRGALSAPRPDTGFAGRWPGSARTAMTRRPPPLDSRRAGRRFG